MLIGSNIIYGVIGVEMKFEFIQNILRNDARNVLAHPLFFIIKFMTDDLRELQNTIIFIYCFYKNRLANFGNV